MQFERTAERKAIWMDVTLEICDPATHAPQGPPFAGRAVDLSAGGMRFDLRHLPSGVAESLHRDVTLSATFDTREAPLGARVFLKVAWFRPAGQSGHASMGAYFSQISDQDRAALMQLAAMHISQKFRDLPASSTGRVARSFGFLALAAVLAFGVFQTLMLQSRLEALSEQIEKISVWVDTQRQNKQQATLSESPERYRPPAPIAPVTKPEPPRVVRQQKPAPPPERSEPAAEPAKLKSVDFVLKEKPDGIGLVTLEVDQSDFIGALNSEMQVDRSVTVALDYPCSRGDAPGKIARCTCEARQMKVPKGRTVEFTCSSSAPFNPAAEDRVVLVSIR